MPPTAREEGARATLRVADRFSSSMPLPKIHGILDAPASTLVLLAYFTSSAGPDTVPRYKCERLAASPDADPCRRVLTLQVTPKSSATLQHHVRGQMEP
jgi:hypothetical protein